MGLIRAAVGAAGGTLADQWKEFFYCESIPENVMAVKGLHRVSGRSSNYKGSENIISNGSVVAVADGQCMIIVDQGKVTELCAEPGEFVYDASTEPSIFAGNLGESIGEVFRNIGKRFTFGGEPPKDQRVYYFNTKELIGNKYGTASPVPFRVVDNNIGLDVDISVRCNGEYSYRITNPLLFYTNVCGNVTDSYTRDKIDSQLKSELLTALQPAFAKISEMGIRYSAIPGHTTELARALNEVLSADWRDLRGVEIVSFGVNSIAASQEDEQMIKDLQRSAAFMDPTRAAAHLVGAQAQAMQDAADSYTGRKRSVSGLVGGDGMIALGANAVGCSGKPLGIVATGSGNDFARGLKLPVNRIETAVEGIVGAIVRGSHIDVDMGRVTSLDGGYAVDPSTGEEYEYQESKSAEHPIDRYYAGMLSCGLDASINDRANHSHLPTGTMRYFAAVLVELAHMKRYGYRIKATLADGTTDERDIITPLLTIANSRHIGGGIEVSPYSCFSDGLLDLVWMDHVPNFGECAVAISNAYNGYLLQRCSAGNVSVKSKSRGQRKETSHRC